MGGENECAFFIASPPPADAYAARTCPAAVCGEFNTSFSIRRSAWVLAPSFRANA